MRPAPAGPLPSLRVRTVAYRREHPEVKHVGLFEALHHRRAAQREGFDDVVFLDTDGTVRERRTWNIGFTSDGAVVWPTAPALAGVTMTLLREAHGPATTRRVPRAGLAGTQAAFATNAVYGVRAITAVDDHVCHSAHPLPASLRAAYDALPADPVLPPAPRSVGYRPGGPDRAGRL